MHNTYIYIYYGNQVRNLGYGNKTCLDSPARKTDLNKPAGLYPCHKMGGNQVGIHFEDYLKTIAEVEVHDNVRYTTIINTSSGNCVCVSSFSRILFPVSSRVTTSVFTWALRSGVVENIIMYRVCKRRSLVRRFACPFCF